MNGSGSYTFSTPGNDQFKESIGGYDKNGNIQSLLRKGKTGNTLGNYGYAYQANTNKLDQITDNGSPLVNYQYNNIGQMTQQAEGGNTLKVEYDAYGLVKGIRDGANALQVSYHYDDGGNRVRNTYYNGGVAARNDFYVHDASGNVMAIYQRPLPNGLPVLKELPIYGSGRVAVFKPQVNITFYEVNDHLGNVRGVLGLPETDSYAASMESENLAIEMQVFSNIDVNNIVPFQNANQTPGGNEVVRLNNSYRVGPSKSLKVSPGDEVSLEVYAYYEAASGYGTTSTSVAALVGAISTAFGGVYGAAGEAGLIYNGVDDAVTLTGVPTNPGDGRPAAYLEYILFDMNYNFVDRGWQIVPETANFSRQRVAFPLPILVQEPGYMFVYLSYDNESANWVYFDELKIDHEHSGVVAGADYYPFGLVMDGREITDEDYRRGYQGQFAEEDSVTGWNQFQLRMYDPRFGRWISPDPYGQFASGYIGMADTPNRSVDSDGGWSWITAGIGFAAGSGAALLTGNEDDWWKWGLGLGLAGGLAFDQDVKRFDVGTVGQKNKVRLSWHDFSNGEIGFINRNFRREFNELYRKPIKKWIVDNLVEDRADVLDYIKEDRNHPDLRNNGARMKAVDATVRKENDWSGPNTYINRIDKKAFAPRDNSKPVYVNPGRIRASTLWDLIGPRKYFGRDIKVTIYPKSGNYAYVRYRIQIHFQRVP